MNEKIRPDIFICFDPEDKAVVSDLTSVLQDNFNIITNDPRTTIRITEGATESAIGDAEFFLYIMSEASLTSRDCKIAYDTARNLNRDRLKQIRFGLVRASKDYLTSNLHEELKRMRAYDLTAPGSPTYNTTLEKLVDDLCRDAEIVQVVKELEIYADQAQNPQLKDKVAQIGQKASAPNLGDIISVGDIREAKAIAIGKDIQVVLEEHQHTLPTEVVERLIRLADLFESQLPRKLVTQKARPDPVKFIIGIILVVTVALGVLLLISKPSPPPPQVTEESTATSTRLPTPIWAEASPSPTVTAEATEEESEPEPVETEVPPPAGLPASRIDSVGSHQMVLVPGGVFKMGSEGFDLDELPTRQVYVSSFYMDIYEVTVAQYADFLIERGNNEVGENRLLDTRNSFYLFLGANNRWEIKAGYADYPITGVTWYGANEYCLRREARLPAEAEWEFAARGPENLTYPWGEALPNCDTVNYGMCELGLLPVQKVLEDKSPFGIYGMGGNAFEWVSDWYSDSYDLAGNDNPTGPATGTLKVLRGGSHQSTNSEVRASARTGSTPTIGVSTYGFRCVRPVEP